MSTLKTKVKLYLETNSKIWDVERNNIIIQNDSDGNGDYIHTWSVDGLAKPTDEQIASYGSSATTEENNNTVRNTRRLAYGEIGDQLDEIYKDIDAWKARIKVIKDKYPK